MPSKKPGGTVATMTGEQLYQKLAAMKPEERSANVLVYNRRHLLWCDSEFKDCRFGKVERYTSGYHEEYGGRTKAILLG